MRKKGITTIRDPVHGDIALTSEETGILDTREMQRLRGIRQLGTAFLVYPGATHTRFEHSIGTLYMADRIFDSLVSHSEGLGIPGEWLDQRARKVIRASALVHDITHIPFGHNIEDQAGLLERHDSPSRMEQALRTGEVSEVLDHMGILEDVLDVLGAGREKVPPFWRDILSDTISADILDYLARDGYYTGLTLKYDCRVITLFRVDRETGKLYVQVEKRGMLREDAVSEILRVLEARYYFSERVYYHHAKVAAGALVTRAVEEALDSGEMEERDLLGLTDQGLVDTLSRCRNTRARAFAKLFMKRELPKRAGVYPAYLNRHIQDGLVERFFTPGNRKSRREWEEKVERELGGNHAVILYCPRRTMQLKETSMLVKMPRSHDLKTLSSLSSEFPRIKDLENSYANLWKLYLFCTSRDEKVLEKAGKIGLQMLPGARNAYSVS